MLGSRNFYCIFDHTQEIFELQAKRQRDDMCKNHNCRVMAAKDAHAGDNWKRIRKVGYNEYDDFAHEFDRTHNYVQMTIWDFL